MIVPGLDVMVAPTGVLAALHAGAHLPLSFSFGVEPNLSLPPQPLFLEGLPYMDGGGRNTFDAIRKTALGRNPANLRRCSRCRSHTQVSGLLDRLHKSKSLSYSSCFINIPKIINMLHGFTSEDFWPKYIILDEYE